MSIGNYKNYFALTLIFSLKNFNIILIDNNYGMHLHIHEIIRFVLLMMGKMVILIPTILMLKMLSWQIGKKGHYWNKNCKGHNTTTQCNELWPNITH